MALGSIDHLVISSATLAEGVDYIEAVLGVPLAGGGQHVLMGTHNRLLSLGPDTYLEVIAVDPNATRPAHARWFDLDYFTGDARLTNWAVRVLILRMRCIVRPPGRAISCSLNGVTIAGRWLCPKMGGCRFPVVHPGFCRGKLRIPPRRCLTTGCGWPHLKSPTRGRGAFGGVDATGDRQTHVPACRPPRHCRLD